MARRQRMNSRSTRTRHPRTRIPKSPRILRATSSWSWTGSLGFPAQRFDSSAVPQGGEFQVGAGGVGPSLAMASNGNFIVVWADMDGVAGQRFDASGAQIGRNSRSTRRRQTRSIPGLASPWVRRGTSRSCGTTSSFSAPGLASTQRSLQLRRDRRGPGPQFQVNTYTPGATSAPAVAVGPTGDFLVSWTGCEHPAVDGCHVFAQRFMGVWRANRARIPGGRFNHCAAGPGWINRSRSLRQFRRDVCLTGWG